MNVVLTTIILTVTGTVMSVLLLGYTGYWIVGWLTFKSSQRKRWQRRSRNLICCGAILFICCDVYLEDHPLNRRYLSDFAEAVFLDHAPSSATVMARAKAANGLFNFRGGYDTNVIVQVSQDDYDNLYKSLQNDSRFRKLAKGEQALESQTSAVVAQYQKTAKSAVSAVFTRHVLYTPRLHRGDYWITFYSDHLHVQVHTWYK